jgi:hypothetical protein
MILGLELWISEGAFSPRRLASIAGGGYCPDDSLRSLSPKVPMSTRTASYLLAAMLALTIVSVPWTVPPLIRALARAAEANVERSNAPVRRAGYNDFTIRTVTPK